MFATWWWVPSQKASGDPWVLRGQRRLIPAMVLVVLRSGYRSGCCWRSMSAERPPRLSRPPVYADGRVEARRTRLDVATCRRAGAGPRARFRLSCPPLQLFTNPQRYRLAIQSTWWVSYLGLSPLYLSYARVPSLTVSPTRVTQRVTWEDRSRRGSPSNWLRLDAPRSKAAAALSSSSLFHGGEDRDIKLPNNTNRHQKKECSVGPIAKSYWPFSAASIGQWC